MLTIVFSRVIIQTRGEFMWLTKLKQMKKISGKTSQQISYETNIPKSTIDKLFSGQTKEPYLLSMKAIVHCMGFSLDDLDNEQNVNIPQDKYELSILNNCRLLNDIGKKKILDYSKDLVDSGNYIELIPSLSAARSSDPEDTIKIRMVPDLSKFPVDESDDL